MLFGKKTHKDTSSTTCVISGAGIAGCLMALALAKDGLHICLIEKGKPPLKKVKKITNGHSAALMNRSVGLLKDLDIWKDIEKFCAPLACLQVIDAAKEPAEYFPFKASEIDEDIFGYNVPNDILHSHLLFAVSKNERIDYHPQTTISEVENQSAASHVTLDDGTQITTPLLIAADGRNSRLRQLAEIDVTRKDYDQSALTFIVSHEKPHDNTSTEVQRPGGVLTFVPLPDQTKSTVVFIDTKDRVEQVKGMAEVDFALHLHSLSQDLLGPLKIESEVRDWPLMTLKAHSYGQNRTALIAESAHVLSPVGAQGLNLSIRDILALRDLIKRYRYTGQDIGSDVLLKAYDRQRKRDIAKRFYGVDGLHSMIRRDENLPHILRRAGLKLVHKTPLLRRFIMRQGMAA